MKRRDAMNDPLASLPDFVYRLRRMGYPGNVRVEFPIYNLEDVGWCAKIIGDLAPELLAIYKASKIQPLIRVLRMRAALVRTDRELKLRTNHRAVKQMRSV